MAGDFDAEEMEKKVIELFSKIPPVENAPERPFYEIPDHEDPVYGLVTDEEADQTIIRYMIRHRKADDGPETFMGHRERYIHQLFNSMMGQRIQELLQKGDPPFVIGVINYGDFERGYEALSAITIPKPNQEELSFTALLTELERVKRYGFTQGELDRAKADILSQWEKYYKERDKISNEEYINDYVDHFLKRGCLSLGRDLDTRLCQAILPTISLADFNQRLAHLDNRSEPGTGGSGSGGEGVEHLTETASMAILEQVASS